MAGRIIPGPNRDPGPNRATDNRDKDEVIRMLGAQVEAERKRYDELEASKEALLLSYDTLAAKFKEQAEKIVRLQGGAAGSIFDKKFFTNPSETDILTPTKQEESLGVAEQEKAAAEAQVQHEAAIDGDVEHYQ